VFFKEAIYLISVLSAKDVIKTLKAHNIHDWSMGGQWLNDVNTVQDNPNYIIDDEKYQVESCKIAHLAYTKEKAFVRSIDVMITERCSLKCKDCSNLMPYFNRPVDYKLDRILDWIYNFMENVDEVMEARVLGGDALMHPNWPEVVAYLASFDKVKRVVVYTNGIIVPKSVSSWDGKVSFAITDYGDLSKNLKKLTSLLAENHIWHKVVKPNYWIDCASIQKHNRTPEENDVLFRGCVSTNLATLVNGKVFRCPYAASAFMLGAAADNPSDYVDVMETQNKQDLADYLSSDKSMSICDYCTSRILTNRIEPAIQTKQPLNYEVVR
jgi:hypothetical protein